MRRICLGGVTLVYSILRELEYSLLCIVAYMSTVVLRNEISFIRPNKKKQNNEIMSINCEIKENLVEQFYYLFHIISFRDGERERELEMELRRKKRR